MKNKLEVWKTAHQLVLEVYTVTKGFPKEELFGLTNQVRRSAVSIPANIVEGQARQHPKEFKQFLYIAKGSTEETNYHLFLSKELGFLSNIKYEKLEDLCKRVRMMLYKLIKSLD